MAVAVHINSVVKTFGSTRAVDAITLHIEPGELFFLLGPSGCGKTTLLRCIAGFYVPESGTLLIGERDVTKLPPHVRDTGMVFQSYALWPHMTVRENVAFGLEQRKIDKGEIRQRVDEALELVRMTNRADHRPNQLSGGQQQRVALARALVIRPKCLLLDEPLSNLDAKLRLDMRSEIRRICKSAGLTAIYVTHDQKEALSVADRLAILDGGKVQQLGSPRDVYLRPNSRFIANFIGETNFISGTVSEVQSGQLKILTEIGIITTNRQAESLLAGDAVTLSIRPEVFQLGEVPAGAINAFEATVQNSVYLGEVAQHDVQLRSRTDSSSNAVVAKVFELNPKFVARDQQVERTTAWVRPEDVVVLTR